jgi:hypothetical protein
LNKSGEKYIGMWREREKSRTKKCWCVENYEDTRKGEGIRKLDRDQ